MKLTSRALKKSRDFPALSASVLAGPTPVRSSLQERFSAGERGPMDNWATMERAIQGMR